MALSIAVFLPLLVRRNASGFSVPKLSVFTNGSAKGAIGTVCPHSTKNVFLKSVSIHYDHDNAKGLFGRGRRDAAAQR
jgi:hypothetical protein